MKLEPRHNATPDEIDAIEDGLYAFNRKATGRSDGEGLGFVLRDEGGRVIAAAQGYSWAGISELKQMWVDEAHRGKGCGRMLLDAFVAEARRRRVKRIWLASYDFQAPSMYELWGFKRIAEFEGWPDGHTNVILCLELQQGK
jgi:GNAT superfamily N-acetyltransferase